jgi:hypothetical protein
MEIAPAVKGENCIFDVRFRRLLRAGKSEQTTIANESSA